MLSPRSWPWWLAQAAGRSRRSAAGRRRAPKPEVGALLRDQLAQLPAPDRQRARAARAGRSAPGAASGGGDAAGGAHPTCTALGATVARRPPAVAVARGVGRVALGEAEEQILERRQLGREREDPDAGARERERQRADGALLGLEAEPVLAGGRVLDAGLRGAAIPARARRRSCAAGSRRRPGGAGRRARPRRRRGPSRRSRRGRTVPAPRAAGGWRAAR